MSKRSVYDIANLFLTMVKGPGSSSSLAEIWQTLRGYVGREIGEIDGTGPETQRPPEERFPSPTVGIGMLE